MQPNLCKPASASLTTRALSRSLSLSLSLAFSLSLGVEGLGFVLLSLGFGMCGLWGLGFRGVRVWAEGVGCRCAGKLPGRAEDHRDRECADDGEDVGEPRRQVGSEFRV